MKVHRLDDEALGNFSYLIDLGGDLGAVVDPRRDVDDYLAAADRLALRIVASFETHLHADFLTGSVELAHRVGAEVFAAADADIAFAHGPVRNDDAIVLGDVEFRVLHTPGHTPEHVSYLAVTGDSAGVFTGGALIAGGAARTDLVSPDQTEPLARREFASVRSLARLDDSTLLFPTHGGGSFCSVAPASGGATTTIGEQRLTNPLMAIDDEDAFVAHLLLGYGAYPPYFLSLRAVNRTGPSLMSDLPAPRPLTPAQTAELIDQGAALVDARPLAEWAERHPRGAIANAFRASFATWLGWTVPFGTPVVLLVADADRHAAVQVSRRIGYEIVGWLEGGVGAWGDAGFPMASVEMLDAAGAAARQSAGAMLIDVRQPHEWAAGRIPGSTLIELGDLVAGKRPGADEVITYCAHGERAATAASLLERQGLAVATMPGGVGAWEGVGLPITT